MSRIFSIRINLDEMFSQLDVCDSDSEKLQWLAGFRAGCRGLTAQTHWPLAKTNGARFGLAAYSEAELFAAQQSQKGIESARVRKERHGTSHPNPNRGSNSGSTVVRETSNLSSNPVIQISNNPINQGNGRAPATPPDLFDGMGEDETPVIVNASVPSEMHWRDWRTQHGAVFVARRGDDGDPDAWESLFKLYGQECFDGMYLALKATGKRIYFNVALTWLEANTKDTV